MKLYSNWTGRKRGGWKIIIRLRRKEEEGGKQSASYLHLWGNGSAITLGIRVNINLN